MDAQCVVCEQKAVSPRGSHFIFSLVQILPAKVAPVGHLSSFIKMVAAANHQALSKRRAQLAGPAGVKGLASNLRTLAIAVFASLGGFVYGCEHASGEKFS